MTQHHKKGDAQNKVTGQKRLSPDSEAREVADTLCTNAPYGKCTLTLLLVFLACIPVFAFAQNTPSENQPIRPSQAVESPMSLDRQVTSEKSDLLSIADQAVRSLIPIGSLATVDAVRVEPDHRPIVYLRYVIHWVEFVDKVRLENSLDVKSPEASAQLGAQLQSRIHWDLLRTSILTQEQATAELGGCDPRLQATAKKLRAPFFNNWTGIHWIPAKDYLALEANAVVDASKNKCVRGIVDLRTGNVVCIKDMACVVD